jgi:hypothetical protein
MAAEKYSHYSTLINLAVECVVARRQCVFQKERPVPALQKWHLLTYMESTDSVWNGDYWKTSGMSVKYFNDPHTVSCVVPSKIMLYVRINSSKIKVCFINGIKKGTLRFAVFWNTNWWVGEIVYYTFLPFLHVLLLIIYICKLIFNIQINK